MIAAVPMCALSAVFFAASCAFASPPAAPLRFSAIEKSTSSLSSLFRRAIVGPTASLPILMSALTAVAPTSAFIGEMTALSSGFTAALLFSMPRSSADVVCQ